MNEIKKYSENNFTEEYTINDSVDYYKLDNFQLYNLARDYRKNIYKLIKTLPSDEKYALEMQMRRAAISISNNIAEGHGRWHFKETVQFCRIAKGSVEEIIDDLNICIDENYYDNTVCRELRKEGYDLIKKINGYISYLKNQKDKSK